jgi:subtilisin family serine protease
MPIPFRPVLILAIGLCTVTLAQRADAQLDLGLIKARAAEASLSQFRAPRRARVPLLVRVPVADSVRASDEGLVRLNTELYTTQRTPGALNELLARHQSWHWFWTPPRRLFLDRAATNVHADTARMDFGRTGRGVVIGIVDTGADVSHPDLRQADGTTRVAYYLDLSQPKPLGLNTELERKYGCTAKDETGEYVAPCAVLSSKDINTLLKANDLDRMPVDAIGHGTHVASLAAGNGLSTAPPKYVGIAPEADLVLVNASRANQGDLQDGDIILGSQFVFDVADRLLHEPAVVNLSLGGDAGAHDGTSDLEKELSALVGPNQPGHALIVAAGNSADLDSSNPRFPPPLGIHTSVQVLPDGNKTRLPVVIDASFDPSSDSQVLVWLQTRAGDNLSLGVDVGSKECVAPIERNRYVESHGCDRASVTLINGIVDESITSIGGGSEARPPMLALIEGRFEQPLTLTLTFTGSGTVFAWAQGTGGLLSGQCEHGVCLPAASRERTVAVPASARDLIAVGATYNRTGWVDVNGTNITLEQLGAGNVLAGDVAGFSGGGPNQLDDLKPEILAPGGLIAAALGKDVDPRKESTPKGGMFDGTGLCPDNALDCLLVDDWHGISLGTSMAAPLVAGTVALMFEADRLLTQQDVRRYLQSGAQKIPGRVLTTAQQGAGLLDVGGALRAQANQTLTEGVVNRVTSWLTLSTALVHPDESWPTRGGLHLRDGKRQAISLDPSRIRVNVAPGRLLAPVELQGYGYYTFDFVAADGSGRQTLRIDVLIDNQLFLQDEMTIGVDVPSARGEVVAGHGCSVARTQAFPRSDSWGWCFTLGLAAVAQHWRHRNRRGSRRRSATP